MTKEEAIKEAYGEYYDKLKNVIISNGWISIHHMQEENVELDFELKTEYEDGFPSDYARPKSLQDLEDNNGWIKIESEANIPEYYIVNKTRLWLSLEKITFEGYFYKSYGGLNFMCSDYDGLPPQIKGKHIGLATSLDGYQPIEKPNPPIY